MAIYNLKNATPNTVKLRIIPLSKDHTLINAELEELDEVGFVRGILLETAYAVTCDGAISYAVIDAEIEDNSTTILADGQDEYTITGGLNDVVEGLEDDLDFKVTKLEEWPGTGAENR